MNILVLLLAIIIPFPLCLFRMKKYNISLGKMLLIYIIFSIVGAVGACVGSAVDGGTIQGKRLYGLMIFDTAALVALSPSIKTKVEDMGDFIALPIMATCFASKIDCIIKGCCYGFTLYQLEMQQPVRFPSAVLEMTIWGVLTVLLLLVEKRGRAKGFLWSIGLVWFGAFRFICDFLRGSALEKRILILGLTGGQFWSLVTLAIGIIFMVVTLTKTNKQKPSIGEFVRTIIGIAPKVNTGQ